MRYIVIKMILLGLMLCVGKTSFFAQNIDIDCNISIIDFNLSENDPDYLFKLGSFSMFENDGHGVITKFYKLPRTKLILSVVVGYAPTDETSSDPQLMIMMVLGKKRVPFSYAESDKFFDEITKYAVSRVQVGYPIEAFDEGGKGVLSMPFLGKKKPVAIGMTCKKVKKEDK